MSRWRGLGYLPIALVLLAAVACDEGGARPTEQGAAPTKVGMALVTATPPRDLPTATTRLMSPTPVPTSTLTEPIRPCQVIRAGEWTGLRLPATTAQLIVVGTIMQVSPARWSTPDGQRPARAFCESGATSNAYIYTPARLSVEQVLKGSVTSTDIEVQLNTGTVGQDVVLTDGEAPIVAGQRVVLFLADIPTGLIIIGRYIINADGTATAALTSTDTWQFDRLLAEIAAHVAGQMPTPTIPPAGPTGGG